MSGQRNETGYKAFTTGAALGKHLRVKLAAGVLQLAGVGASDPNWIGTTTEASFAAAKPQTVRLRNSQGTELYIYSGSGSAGDVVYGAASGKVSSTPSGKPIGYLFEACADGDVVEVLPIENAGTGVPVVTVASAGSTQSDAAALTAGALNTVTGADGTKGVLLPAAAAGLTVDVYNAVATNGLKIWPASGDTINGGSGDAAITIEGKTLARLLCVDGTNWAAQFTANT